MDAMVDPTAWAQRDTTSIAWAGIHNGHGRELFALMRRQVSPAEQGACSLFQDEPSA
jgi:phosphogluconate dehydratase